MSDLRIVELFIVQRLEEAVVKTKAVNRLMDEIPDEEKAAPGFFRRMNDSVFEANQGVTEMMLLTEVAILVFGSERAGEIIHPCIQENSAAAAGQPTGGNCGASPVSVPATSQPTPTRESTSSQ